MSELKLKPVTLIDCHDLDDFLEPILATYDIEWRALRSNWDGYHNGSMETCEVIFGALIEEDTDANFMRWLNGGLYNDEDSYSPGGSPGIQEMLQWLCNRGQIPSGTYVVDLWW